jgi:hypothetical protein
MALLQLMTVSRAQADQSRAPNMRFPSLLLRISVFIGIHAGFLIWVLTLF